MFAVNRRGFLKVISLATAGVLSWRFFRKASSREGMVTGPNAFTGEGKALVSRIEHDGELKGSVSGAVGLIGGFEKAIEEGDRVLLKPNFNTADPPPASSDPEFIKAIIELLYENGAGEVIIGESSTAAANTRDVLEEVGMIKIAEEAGARVVVFDEEEWVNTATKGIDLQSVYVAEEIFRADKLVYALCMKTHSLASFTGALKLAVGIARPRDRLMIHTFRLEEKIADLNTVVHPDLMILDARRCFISGGPSKGVLREPNLILASGDRVALDVEAIKVMQGYEGSSLKGSPWEFGQIKRAVELGLGAGSEKDYEVVEL